MLIWKNLNLKPQTTTRYVFSDLLFHQLEVIREIEILVYKEIHFMINMKKF